ncbi:hypothetical protein M5689_000141 [Euphorbia peplus]|nr:hypothetical protein M5689_000141 [Euphorbia peplus]
MTTKWLPVLCFILLLAAGTTSAIEPTACLGECSQFPDCNNVCLLRGYGKGGGCLSIDGSPLNCCCLTS